MNELMIYNWNQVVDEDDIVYHLGDFALGGRAINLSHYPQQKNKKVDFSIFGHIHNHHDECIIPGTYCVSVERINYTPILLDDIIYNK